MNQFRNIYICIYVVTAFAVTMFFSCKPNTVNRTNLINDKEAPIAEAFEVNMKYTDSGRLVAIMKAPRFLDFTNKTFSYWEFPDGVVLDMIDPEGKISTITSDYAISYSETGLVDMRGNVDIKTADSTHLQAQQLYWDQTNSWVFTDQPYRSYFPDGTVNDASGFDANQDFSILNSRTNDGIMIIED